MSNIVETFDGQNTVKITSYQRAPDVEDELFRTDFMYRLLFHPAYIARQIHNIAEDLPLRHSNLGSEKIKLEWTLLSNFLAIIAEQIGSVSMPAEYTYNNRIRKEFEVCQDDPISENFKPPEGRFINLIHKKDVEKILCAMQVIITNVSSSFKFRALFLYAIYREENIRAIVSKMCPERKFSNFLDYLNRIFNEEYFNSSFMSSLNQDNCFNGIVKMVNFAANEYVTEC